MNEREYIMNMRESHPRNWVSMVKRDHPEIHQSVMDYDTKHTLQAGNNSQMYYNYCHSITTIPTCNITGNALKFMNNVWEYRKYGKRGVASLETIKQRGKTRKVNGSNYSINSKLLDMWEKYIGTNLMSKDDMKNSLISLINGSINAGGIISKLVSTNEVLAYNIMHFQRNNDIEKLSEAIYCIVHDILPKTCKITGNRADFLNFKEGYSPYSTDNNNRSLITGKRRNTIHDNMLNAIENSEMLSTDEIGSLVKRLIRTDYENIKCNPKQYFTAKYPQLIKPIERRTEYLKGHKFSEKLYHIYNDLSEIPKNKFNNRAKFETFSKGYRICENAYNCSNIELEIRKYISTIYQGSISSNDKSALKNRQELDIYLPELNIGIEIDGEYYHSEKFKPKSYHLDKTKSGEAIGIRIIHIWAGEWEKKPEIVKSMLSNLLGKCENVIYARNCTIQNISPKDKNIFLEENHLQGRDNSKYKLGAFHNGTLVAVMTFGTRQISKVSQFELIRFCSKTDYRVVGIASKLFKHFVNNYSVNEIVTYADRRWSKGSLYEKLGFTFSHNSSINYYYYKAGVMHHRTSFQKHKLQQRLCSYDYNLTEYANMNNNGYSRVWDCGQLVYKWSRL